MKEQSTPSTQNKKSFSFWGLKKDEDKETLEKKKASWDMRSSKIKTSMFIIALFAELGFIYALANMYGFIEEDISQGDKIAVIDFKKIITQDYVNKVIKSLEKIKKDKEYLEVLFIMNSPGGSPTASEELSEYLKDYTKEKHINMYVQAIAASGGYYISSAIKPLIANKNALVGSIGVIMPHYNIKELAKTIGIEEDDLSAGKFKKPISLFRKLTDKEKSYLKTQILTPTYNNFISSVANNREMNVSDIIPFTEGKIYIANDPSIKNMLVDEILVLHRLKARIEKRHKQQVSFVSIMPKSKMGILGEKVEFNFNINTEVLGKKLEASLE